jgi:hypothetical protein
VETRADEIRRDEGTSQANAPVNGAARHSDVARPVPDAEHLESLRYEEILANINRDYTVSVVPPSFILHETPAEHQERLRQTRAGLAALRGGDPHEHRETLEAVLRSLDDDASWKEEPSSE